MTMPGLPSVPAANSIKLNDKEKLKVFSKTVIELYNFSIIYA